MSTYRNVRSDDQIDDLLNDCAEAEDAGSLLPGMSYEQGIAYAVKWLTDVDEPHPLEE